MTDSAAEPNSNTVEDSARPLLPADFESIYRAEFPYVFRSLRRLGVRERELEDVAHDVFLAVYRRFDEYDPQRPVRPWLFAFAHRIAADHRRLARHRHESPDRGEDAPSPGRLPDEHLADERARRALLRALDALDDDRRAVLIMHDLEGHSMPEIAAAFAIPLNTAYSRLRLARRDLNAAVQSVAPAEPPSGEVPT
jgi:RNA polymerase sigma-70 factor (ECF subfamily)